MASTYSALKIELIGTGEQSGTWGTTTNTNLGDAALGEAITGSADVAFSSADVTVTLTDTNATQAARNLRLNLTGTTGGARSLILGSGCQIEKLYLINNTCADAITVKNTTGTGIAVPAGKTMFVFNNGTNVVDVTTYLSSLTLGSALPIASGGTGSTSTTFVNAATNVTGTLPIANGGTGSASTTFVNAATNVTGTLPIANGGTGSASTTFVNAATNVTGTLPIANGGTGSASTTYASLTANVTGTLPVANGGTGDTTYTNGQLLIGNTTGNTLTKATLTAGTGITVTNGSGAITIAAASSGGQFQTEIFTSPGTWTKPSSASQVRVTVVGGGGGGGTFSSGGFGGVAIAITPVSAPVSITIGTGGAPNGGAGGTSSFGPAVSATGGSAGSGTPGSATPGAGTVSVGTAIAIFNSSSKFRDGSSGGLFFGGGKPSGPGQNSAQAYSSTITYQAGGGGGSFSNPTAWIAGGVGGAILVEFVG